MHEWGFFGMGFWWLMPLLLFGLLFMLLNNRTTFKDDETAEDILDKRYANGEISEEEYKRRKANLKH